MEHELERERLSRVKRAYTTRRVPVERMRLVVEGPGCAPRAGDLVLARVQALGEHARIELCGGRRAQMFCSDEIIVCYGDRYAPDQYEAEVPADLGPCDLVAGGGVAGRMLCRHSMIGQPTRIVPLGLVCDRDGGRLNLSDFALVRLQGTAPQRPPTLAVTGTCMNSGKTTTAASLVRGLSRTGLRVGATKLTGTGAGGDVWRLADAGAAPVLDFTDAGLVSTYRVDPATVLRAADLLQSRLASAAVDVIVLEIADGLYQHETAALLRDESFISGVDRFMFAAADAIGAVAGVALLRELELPVAGVSGLLTASTLATREAEQALDVPVVGPDQLADPAHVERLGLLPDRARFVLSQHADRREHEPLAEPSQGRLLPTPAAA